MLEINDLLVSQESVEARKIREMAQYVKDGGLWTTDILMNYDREQSLTLHGDGFPSPLIAITEFEDGTRLIHNGHHRIRATWDFRKYLFDNEYIISYRPLEDYLRVDFSKGFVTPYDPRVAIRVFDFYDFKCHALKLASKDPAAALNYIKENSNKYQKPRAIFKVSELHLTEISRNRL